MKKENKSKEKMTIRPSVAAIDGLPDTAQEMINRYGTYEIQATASTENQYPAIAQGFNEKIIKNDCENTNCKDKN